MSKTDELIQQKAELGSEIRTVSKKEKAKAFKPVRRLSTLDGFTFNQVKEHLVPLRKSPNKSRIRSLTSDPGQCRFHRSPMFLYVGQDASRRFFYDEVMEPRTM